MRVAYHVQSHRDPDLVLRLVARLRADLSDCVVLVSHDRTGPPLDPSRVRDLAGDDDGVRVLPAAGGYGDWSHVARYLETAEHLAARDDPYDWLVNLSGQDYPLRHGRLLVADLASRTADAWLEDWPVLGPDSHWSPRRVHERYATRYRRVGRVTARRQRLTRPLALVGRLQPWVRVNPAYQAVGRAVSPAVPLEQVRGGSFFGALDRRAVQALRTWAGTRPDEVAWAAGVLAPEEMVLQTMPRRIDPGLVVHPDCRRWFDFSTSRANHPRTLTIADLPALRASGAWFGRKVDAAVDVALLDELDRLAATD